MAPAKTLTQATVFARIRPIIENGKSGHTDGEAVNKKLASWTESTVTIREDDQRKDTTYRLKQVIPPEADQQQTYNVAMAELVEAFTADSNVMYFAYGQTGSGKTHTMLGEIESLSSPTPVEGWGLFPRAVHSTLETMKKWRAEGAQCILFASAIEFYCGAAFDLNSSGEFMGKREVTIDKNMNLFGASQVELKSTRQLKKWITRMYANRTTAKTKMNDASSRSHCAFILTLHRLTASDDYLSTTLSLVDMAGSERCAKAGYERVSMQDCEAEIKRMMEQGTPELLSIGAQGVIINYELSYIATEVLKAADMHRKGVPFQAQKECSTAASFYFSACCDGRARVGSVITCSQSPQHGFETWFSLRFGEQLAVLQVPLKPVQPVPVAKALEAAKQAAEEASEKLAKANPNPQGAKQWRVHSLVVGMAQHTAEALENLQRLIVLRSCSAEDEAEAEESDSSEGSEIFAMAFPARIRAKKAANFNPHKSALEMGRINDNFSVFIRVRPLLEREMKAGAKNCFAISDIDFPREPPPQRITVQDGVDCSARGSYVFNRVFHEATTQREIYAATAQPYVADFLQGTNVTIFAYGQTGTGKTYTIDGPQEDPGIMARCLEDVFAGLAATGKELHYEYVQLYMADFKDLLEDSKGELKLTDVDGTVFLRNSTCRKANSPGEVMAALREGAKRRTTRSQDMNEVSSRSHAILMLRLVDPGRPRTPDPTGRQSPGPSSGTVTASMFVVDLAGSERISRSGVTGQGFDEAAAINQSLSALGRVVVTLIQKSDSTTKYFVPYNGSPLTMLLKAGLGGNSKTALIACVTQATDSISESLSTLRFAMQASHVKNKVDKKDEKDKADKENQVVVGSGHELTLVNGRATVALPTGEMEVFGAWDTEKGAKGRVVILLGGLGVKVEIFKELVEALAAKGCQVLAPIFANTSAEKKVQEDVDSLIALLDWLGVAAPVLYGRDFGAIRAAKFKICHPKRAATLVLEERSSRLDSAGYREVMKKGTNAMSAWPGYGPLLWMFDNAFPASLTAKAGSNMNGFSGKVVLLFPFCNHGKHDASGSSVGKIAQMYGNILKTKPVDSYLLSEEDVAGKIAATFPKAA